MELPEINPALPRIIIAQRVIDKILKGALLYPDPETGEAMVGLIAKQEGRPEPDIYVLDTISPGEHAIREWGMFEQGGDWQADVFNWLHINWEAFRDLRRSSYGSAVAAKWDMPLAHVGDWHKQPGDMTEPSPGDLQTARDMIADPETGVAHLLVPIVTMRRLREDDPATHISDGENSAPSDVTPPDASAITPEDTESKAAEPDSAGRFRIRRAGSLLNRRSPGAIEQDLEDDGWRVRIDFWYVSRAIRQFEPVIPVIWPDNRLPSLPQVSWHLQHQRRFNQEYDLLAEAGYALDVVRWDADGKPPYELCFSAYKPGSQHVFVLVTSWDYPVTMPALRVAPLVRVEEDEDVFEKIYTASRPVLMNQLPNWEWDSKRTLVELVWHIENTLDKENA